MQSAPETYELREDMPEYDASRSLPASRTNQYEDDSFTESNTLLDNETIEELPSSE